MNKKTRYPSYNVMKEKEHWDRHTRQIVSSRLAGTDHYAFLTKTEVDLLTSVCSLLTGDNRKQIISYIISHIDQTLHSPVGEGQRKPNIPEGYVLVRLGLQAMNHSAREKFGCSFTRLTPDNQRQFLTSLHQEQALTENWNLVPQKELFKKLLKLTLEAYYSHPTVWSEIGYGGPAYPRGYVRTQLGQLDPWEAQPEHE